MKLSQLYNPIMQWLLGSPLHGIISGMYMVVHFTGRKSGKAYSTPVEYFTDGDDVLFLTAGERVWWRNLRDDAPVHLVLKGRRRDGVANASLGDAAVYADAVKAYLQKFPGRAKYFDADPETHVVDPAAAERLAQERVVVRIRLA